MKTFNIPDFYRSRIITPIKEFRRKNDKLKRDYAPTMLDFGPVQFLIARHFGFCYGVENAIDIAYKAIAENPDKRIFLLSEMIHNPDVNRDLDRQGRALPHGYKRKSADCHGKSSPPRILSSCPHSGQPLKTRKSWLSWESTPMYLRHHLPICGKGLEPGRSDR
jgi:hypothetical protein